MREIFFCFADAAGRQLHKTTLDNRWGPFVCRPVRPEIDFVLQSLDNPLFEVTQLPFDYGLSIMASEGSCKFV